MKESLIVTPILLFIVIAIAALEEYQDVQFQLRAEQSNVYKMPNGVSFFGTKEEAENYKKWLEKQGQKQ